MAGHQLSFKTLFKPSLNFYEVSLIRPHISTDNFLKFQNNILELTPRKIFIFIWSVFRSNFYEIDLYWISITDADDLVL